MRRAGLALAAGATTLLVAAGAPAVLAATVSITFPEAEDAAPYTPSLPEIQPGDSVTFTGGFVNHPLRWLDGDFTTQDAGSERTYVFPRPGSYRFVCDFHTDMTGRVLVLGNQVALPDFTVSPAVPAPGATVTFDARAVADPNPGGTITRYEWDLDGDGTFERAGADAVVARRFDAAGTYLVRLRVVDDGHDTSTVKTRSVVVSQPAAPGLTAASRSRAITVRGGIATIGLRLDESASIAARLRKGRGSVVLGRGTAKLGGGTGVLRVKLTAAGVRAVKRGRRTRLTLVLTARDAAGNARTVSRTLTLTR